MRRYTDTDHVKAPILPTIGEGISFECRGYHEEYGPAITVRRGSDFTRDGLRKVKLEISSWVGISMGAHHHYAKLKWEGCTFNTPEGEPHPQRGCWPNNMPKEAETTELEVRRPVTQRDIDYAKRRKDGWIPKPGDTERGFWSEEEARQGGISCFKERFAPGWALYEYNEEGELAEVART